MGRGRSQRVQFFEKKAQNPGYCSHSIQVLFRGLMFLD